MKLSVPSLAILLGLTPFVLATTTVPTTTYNAGQSVTVTDGSTVQTGSGATVTVNSGASISYQAGTSIILNAGFTAQAGSYFNAFIDTGLTPSLPTGIEATSQSSTYINLLWTPSTDIAGVTHYKIFRNGIQIGTSALPTFTDTTVTSGWTSYSYTIIAVDAVGQTATSSAVTITAASSETSSQLLDVSSGTNYTDTSTTLNFSVYQPQ